MTEPQIVVTARCVGSLMCQEIAPHAFQFDEATNSAAARPDAVIDDDVELAVDSCPVRAIQLASEKPDD